MKNQIRWLFAGVLATAVSIVSALATTALYSTATWNGPSGAYQAQWTITTSAATDITGNITLTAYAPSGAGGGNYAYASNGSQVFQVLLGQFGIGTSSNSGAVYGLPADTYKVVHSFGGAPNTVYGQLNTTLSW